MLEKTLERPLDSTEIKTVISKGYQPWIFFGSTDAEAPILWPLDMKSQLIGKDSNAGRDWGQVKKRVTEDDMGGWYHRLNGHEFEQDLGDGKGQGSLVCFSPWDHKESDTTEQLHFRTSIHDYWENHSFDYRTSVAKVVSLLFFFFKCCLVCHNFSSKDPASLNFMAVVTIHSDFGAQENKVCHRFHCFPIYLPWSAGVKCHDLPFFECWVLSQLVHSPFHFHQAPL